MEISASNLLQEDSVDLLISQLWEKHLQLSQPNLMLNREIKKFVVNWVQLLQLKNLSISLDSPKLKPPPSSLKLLILKSLLTVPFK